MVLVGEVESPRPSFPRRRRGDGLLASRTGESTVWRWRHRLRVVLDLSDGTIDEGDGGFWASPSTRRSWLYVYRTTADQDEESRPTRWIPRVQPDGRVSS